MKHHAPLASVVAAFNRAQELKARRKAVKAKRSKRKYPAKAKRR